MKRFNYQALGRLKSGEMNKTEKKYADKLEQDQALGKVVWWKFEGIKFRLADKTFYSPDFAVMKPTGEIEIHEIKGFMTDDANVKVKVAADMYPFKFFVVKWLRGQWEMKEVG